LIRNKVLAALREKMEVDQKGTLQFALDMRVQRDPRAGVLKLSQRQYIDGLMDEYKITGIRSSPAPLDDLTEEDLPKSESEKREAEKIPVGL